MERPGYETNAALRHGLRLINIAPVVDRRAIMRNLADCLALTIVHIATRQPCSDEDEDDDVRVLESIAADLQSASADEITALSESAQRLAAIEKDADRRDHFQNLLAHLGIDP